MTRFLKDKMTLKTNMMVWEPMATIKGLVSCVICLDERLWPSMTSTNTNVLFSIITNLYCHTSSLSIKHVDMPESKSVWASIITSLLHFTMIGTKKHGVGSGDKLGPFSLHDASSSNLTFLIETKHVYFPTLLVVDW
jgi:hypothetical protein